MSLSELLLTVYTVFVVTASFVHLIRLDYWWIRMWDFPHMQLATMAGVGLLAWGYWAYDHPEGRLPWLAVGLVASLSYQGWLIWPYTPLHRRQVIRWQRKPDADENTLKLLVSNVLMTNTECPKLLKLVEKHQPDILLVLEGNGAWQRELKSLEETYPHRILYPLENTYGMLLYSRLPISEPELRFLVQDDIPSVRLNVTLRSGQRVRFYGVHPMPPSPTEHYRSTERDAELLLVGREVRKFAGPVVVAGDLNDVAWSHTTRLFARVSGLFDPRIGRGLFSTFHAQYFFMRWPLDHVFVSHHFRLRAIHRLPACGSDHFPILLSVVYDPNPKRAREAPRPEGDDLEEAAEKIQEAKG